MKQNRVFNLLLSLTLLFMSGCYNHVIEQAQNLQSDCQVPCWYGFTPGLTSEEEFIIFANEAQRRGIFVYEKISDGNYLIFMPQIYTVGYFDRYQVTFVNGVVHTIASVADAFPLKIQQVLDDLGPPAAYGTKFPPKLSSATDTCLNWNADDYLGPSSTKLGGYLMYPDKGAMYYVIKSRHFPNMLCPDVIVTQFTYGEPTTLEEMTESWIEELETGDLYEWKGYGGGY